MSCEKHEYHTIKNPHDFGFGVMLAFSGNDFTLRTLHVCIMCGDKRAIDLDFGVWAFQDDSWKQISPELEFQNDKEEAEE